MLFPREYGGAQGSATDVAIVLEQICRHWMTLGLIYHTAAIFPLGIHYFGTEEQKRNHLPPIADGRMRFAFSLTEPNAGSDAASVSTLARRDGDEFVINGAKVFTSGADVADRIALVTRTETTGPRHRGLSVFLLDPRTPGVDIRRIPKVGLKGLSTCQVFLDNVRVPASTLLGKLNDGWTVVLRTLHMERLSIGARCTGGCQAVVDAAVRYASERQQFGQAIGKFQAIQHLVADMEILTEAARMLTYRLAWMIDSGLDCAREASVVKVFASEAYSKIAAMGMQVLGGYGYTMEYEMQRHYRDAKIYEIGGGTSQIQRNVIAKSLGL